MVNAKEFVEQIKEELDNLGRLSNEVNILLSESKEEQNGKRRGRPEPSPVFDAPLEMRGTPFKNTSQKTTGC